MRTALLILLVLLTPLAHSQSSLEKTLFDKINQARAEEHLPPFAWDPALARAAKIHADHINGIVGVAMHQYDGEPDLRTRATEAGAKYTTLVENLAGSASNVDIVYAAWMMSPAYRRNILNPGLNSIGISVVGKEGAWYTVADLSSSRNSTNSVVDEKRVQELLRDLDIRLEPSEAAQDDAHKSCESDEVPQRDPVAILQWESADFTKLPPDMVRRLPKKSDKPHTAAVASCPSKNPTAGYITYRMTVLVY